MVERHKLSIERVDTTAECEKCGRKGIRFSEMQTRSADEGSTIAYNCDCGHRYVVWVTRDLYSWVDDANHIRKQVVDQQLRDYLVEEPRDLEIHEQTYR
jgi:lysyl-tRNA synthetase class I